MTFTLPTSNVYTRPGGVPEAVVDVIIGVLYQKAVVTLPSLSGNGVYPDVRRAPLRRGPTPWRQRFWRDARHWPAGAERRMTFDLLAKLTSMFQAASWGDSRLEPLITYRFCFTLRLFLVNNDPDFRVAACRIFRYLLLSDRILQLCCDLFIPELVTMALERVSSFDVSSTVFDRVRESSSDVWNLEERVAGLKFIRQWCNLVMEKKTVVAIPTCFLRGLVAAASPEEPSGRMRAAITRFDPLRIFCLETLGELCLRLEDSLFYRLAQTGGVSVMVDNVRDGITYQIEPTFCHKVIVALCQVFGDKGRRCSIFETTVRSLRPGTQQKLLPVTLIFQQSTEPNPWKSWWFWELASFCSSLVDVLTRVFPEQGYLGFLRGKLVGGSDTRRIVKKQQKEMTVAFHTLRVHRWKAATAAFLVLCQSFAGLFAVAVHPYGLRCLIQLLWQPLESPARLDLVMLFMRLILLGLSVDGRPVETQHDLFCLVFTRAFRNWRHLTAGLQNPNQKQSMRPEFVTEDSFTRNATRTALQEQTLSGDDYVIAENEARRLETFFVCPSASSANSGQQCNTYSSKALPSVSSISKPSHKDASVEHLFTRPFLEHQRVRYKDPECVTESELVTNGSEQFEPQWEGFLGRFPTSCISDKGGQRFPQHNLDCSAPTTTEDNASSSPLLGEVEEVQGAQFELESHSNMSGASSLAAMSYPECLGFTPLEGTLAAGFGTGAYLDLRDLFGLLLVRICLHEGLHIALASIVVTLGKTVHCHDDALHCGDGGGFRLVPRSLEISQETDATASLLLTRSTQLLSIIVCVASSFGPTISRMVDYLVRTPHSYHRKSAVNQSLNVHADHHELETVQAGTAASKHISPRPVMRTLLTQQKVQQRNVKGSGHNNQTRRRGEYSEQAIIERSEHSMVWSYEDIFSNTGLLLAVQKLLRDVIQCVSLNVLKRQPTHSTLLNSSFRLSRGLYRLFQSSWQQQSTTGKIEGRYGEPRQSEDATSPYSGSTSGMGYSPHQACRSVRYLQRLLAYAKFYTGPIAHAAAYYDLRVSRISQFSIPFQPPGKGDTTSPDAAISAYVRATGVTYTSSTAQESQTTSSLLFHSNPDNIEDVVKGTWSSWNWPAVYEVLGGLSQPYIHQFTAVVLAREFLRRLVYFFLPSQQCFAVQPWHPSQLNWVACGVNLFLVLCVLDEPADVPNVCRSTAGVHTADDSAIDGVLHSNGGGTAPMPAASVQTLLELRTEFVAEVVELLRTEVFLGRQELMNNCGVSSMGGVGESCSPSTEDCFSSKVFRERLFHTYSSWQCAQNSNFAHSNPHEYSQRSLNAASLSRQNDGDTQLSEQRSDERDKDEPPSAAGISESTENTQSGGNSCGDSDDGRRILSGGAKTIAASKNGSVAISSKNEGDRLFSPTMMRSCFAREYATFIGAMSATRRGIILLLENNFFRVLSELVFVGNRDFLVLLFLKQLSRIYMPCRTLIEMAVTYGSQTLRLHVLHHFNLICEGGGIPTPFSDIAVLHVTCPYSSNGSNHSVSLGVAQKMKQCSSVPYDVSYDINGHPLIGPAAYNDTNRILGKRGPFSVSLAQHLHCTEIPNLCDYNSDKTASAIIKAIEHLIAKESQWRWILRWSLTLVFSICPNEDLKLNMCVKWPTEESRDEETCYFDPFLMSHPDGHSLRVSLNRCFASHVVAETALHLVTQLCRLGNGSTEVEDLLFLYLPDSRSLITIPSIHSSHCSCLVKRQLCPHYLPRVSYSCLKDWPSSLKIHLLRTDRGTHYLLQSQWLHRQLHVYMNHAEGIAQNNCSQREIRKSHAADSQRLRRRMTATPTTLGSIIKDKERRAPLESTCPLYVNIINTLLRHTFVESGDATRLRSKRDNERFPSVDDSSEPCDGEAVVSLMIPDPYRYHFYCSAGLCNDPLYPFRTQRPSCSVPEDLRSGTNTSSLYCNDAGGYSLLGPTEQNILYNESSLNIPVWSARKRNLQSRHQRSPYEFLAHLPFRILIQSMEKAIDSATHKTVDKNVSLEGKGSGTPVKDRVLRSWTFDACAIRCLPPSLCRILGETFVSAFSNARNSSNGQSAVYWDEEECESPLFFSLGDWESSLSNIDLSHVLQWIDMNSNATAFQLCALPYLQCRLPSCRLRASIMVGTFYVTSAGTLTRNICEAAWSNVELMQDVIRDVAMGTSDKDDRGDGIKDGACAKEIFCCRTVTRSGANWTFRVHKREDQLQDVVLSRLSFPLDFIEPCSLDIPEHAAQNTLDTGCFPENSLWQRSRLSCTKPPATLLSYVALTRAGLEFLENEGYLAALERQLEVYDQQSTNKSRLRNVIWSIGHLVSSELGVQFLSQRRPLLQRLIEISYKSTLGSLQGTIIYALGLIPITAYTTAVCRSMGWDLTVRGPAEMRFCEFFSLNPSCDDQHSPVSLGSPVHADAVTHRPVAGRGAASPFATTSVTPELSDTLVSKESTVRKNYFLELQEASSDNVEWRAGSPTGVLLLNKVELPESAVAGFDLSQLLFKVSFNPREIALFGLYTLQHKMRQKDGFRRSSFSESETDTFFSQFHSFLFERGGPIEQEESQCLLIEACVPVNYLAYVPWSPRSIEYDHRTMTCSEASSDVKAAAMTAAPANAGDACDPAKRLNCSEAATENQLRLKRVTACSESWQTPVRFTESTSMLPELIHQKTVCDDHMRMPGSSQLQSSTSSRAGSPIMLSYGVGEKDNFVDVRTAGLRKEGEKKGDRTFTVLSYVDDAHIVCDTKADVALEKGIQEWHSLPQSGARFRDNSQHRRPGDQDIFTASPKLCRKRPTGGLSRSIHVDMSSPYEPCRAEQHYEVAPLQLDQSKHTVDVQAGITSDAVFCSNYLRPEATAEVPDLDRTNTETSCAESLNVGPEQLLKDQTTFRLENELRSKDWRPQLSGLSSSDLSEGFEIDPGYFQRSQNQGQFTSAWGTEVEAKHTSYRIGGSHLHVDVDDQPSRNGDCFTETKKQNKNLIDRFRPTIGSGSREPGSPAARQDYHGRLHVQPPFTRDDVPQNSESNVPNDWNTLLAQLIYYLRDQTLPPCSSTAFFQLYTDGHKNILNEIATLMNRVATRSQCLITSLRKKRNAHPHLFLSVELWWRVQMLLRMYTFTPKHRSFIVSLFTETFQSVEAWFYLDLLTQYVKWHCTIPTSEYRSVFPQTPDMHMP